MIITEQNKTEPNLTPTSLNRTELILTTLNRLSLNSTTLLQKLNSHIEQHITELPLTEQLDLLNSLSQNKHNSLKNLLTLLDRIKECRNKI